MTPLFVLLLGIFLVVSLFAAATSTALRHGGSIIGEKPSSKSWDYKKTPAYKLGLTRLHVYVLWWTGLWVPFIIFRAIRSLPSEIIEGYASDKKALDAKKREDLEKRKKRIEREYREVVMEFEEWDEKIKENASKVTMQYYDTL